MDKRALQSYAVWAKTNLENQIEVQLKTLGINSERDIKTARVVGDRTIIDGDMNSYPADLKNKRDSIVRLVQEDGYKQVIEEFAYTWFNRIVALRFMEVHDFLPHGFRVLSSRTGGFEPEIMKNLNFVKDELKLDLSVVAPLMEQGKIDEAYRYVLFRQCKALSGILPMLFSSEQSYLELLLPKALLKGETFITKLLEINEENFLNDVEVIGWLYQFYISQKKDEVFASKATITKDTLPAVTQLFTPDWIVRYMAENSVGRIWLESYPNSVLKGEMKYYVEDAEQEEEVQKKLDEAKYKNVNPENIKIIEPCCGSGHILVYVFDLLYKMYEEKGYAAREIPTLILKKNLTGLDVDKRAAQLASFSLIMKARSVNSRFFNETYYTVPKVYEIWDSRSLIHTDYLNQIKETKLLSIEQIKEIEWLAESFRNAKTIGSLLKVDAKHNLTEIFNSVNYLEKNAVINIFNSNFLTQGIVCLKKLITQAEVLSSKYDVFITNPPYVNINNIEKEMKDYANSYYGISKSDMFSMFIDHSFDMTSSRGYSAFMTPYVWMFIKAYEDIRKYIIKEKQFVSLCQLEYSALEEAIVPLCTFILQNTKPYKDGAFFRLTEFKGGMKVQDERYLYANQNKKCGYFYYSDVAKFNSVPGSPLAYWVNEHFADNYKNKKISNYAEVITGMTIGDNNKYLRLWYEISFDRLALYQDDMKNIDINKTNWIPYSKGGERRNWYGNYDYVVNWKEKANFNRSKTTLQHLYLREALTWPFITSGDFSCRLLPKGFLWDVAGSPCFFEKEEDELYALGFLGSKVANYILKVVNPTINVQAIDIAQLPLIEIAEKNEVIDTVKKCIETSKEDWDSFETSWDFKKCPLIASGKLSDLYAKWKQDSELRFNKIKEYELKLNKYFIDAYKLSSELTADQEDKYITIKCPELNRDIKNLISYLIGVEMGRYSLDVEGLSYAGGEWNSMNYVTYQPDDDGIIPVYPQLGMADGLTARIIKLIKHIYGEDTYKENIDFIADALGKKTSESSEETLNRYLNEGFYADHLKTYQKRPIYWMFSSGKNDAFKCLVYLHRYNEDTLARINSKYFLNESARLNAEVNDTAAQLETADGREKLRLDKLYKTLSAKQKEMLEYGWVLDHMANQYIPLDLDDGVKVNYAKFQGIEIVNDNGAKVKKDLLVPIK